MRYAVVIEKGERNYSAYVPDLPGCVSVGDTPEEVTAEIREAIEFHLQGMREDGLPIPKPSSQAEYVEVGGQAAERLRRQEQSARRGWVRAMSANPAPNAATSPWSATARA
jgi:predicted RNase H-like HicB family nuclease